MEHGGKIFFSFNICLLLFLNWPWLSKRQPRKLYWLAVLLEMIFFYIACLSPRATLSPLIVCSTLIPSKLSWRPLVARCTTGLRRAYSRSHEIGEMHHWASPSCEGLTSWIKTTPIYLQSYKTATLFLTRNHSFCFNSESRLSQIFLLGRQRYFYKTNILQKTGRGYLFYFRS